MEYRVRPAALAAFLAAAISLTTPSLPALSQPSAGGADPAQLLAVGDYAAATERLRQRADEGDTQAQLMLADLYLGGHGTDHSLPLAIAWLDQAAYGGNVHAMVRLGTIHKNFGSMLTGGSGFESWPTAVGWFIMAAAAGSAEGAFQAGITFDAGIVSRESEVLSREVEADLARRFLAQAAAAGDARALWRLAMMDRDAPDFVDRLRAAAIGIDGVGAQAMLANSDLLADQLTPRERFFWGLVTLRNIEMTGNDRLVAIRSADEFAAEVDALGTALNEAERSAVEAEAADFVAGWVDPYP